MRRRSILVLAVVATTVIPGLAVTYGPALPALADGIKCTHLVQGNLTYFTWYDGTREDVQGVRAPIQVRKDGTLCDPNYVKKSVNYSWIMVHQIYSPTNLVQIGYEEYYKGGIQTICKFWAIQGGNPSPYDCGHLSNLDFTWFTIHPTSNGTHYVLADCGDGGTYTACTAKDSSQTMYTNPVGVVANEQ